MAYIACKIISPATLAARGSSTRELLHQRRRRGDGVVINVGPIEAQGRKQFKNHKFDDVDKQVVPEQRIERERGI